MPDTPAADAATSDLRAAVAAAFADDGAFARVVTGYEPRDGQRRMADAVGAALDEGGTLLAEAGTGTGKTLAYLVPAILSRKRVIVSTGTKNLQEQVFFKDLPALRDALDVPFTATLMKGRSNYLCLHRFETYRDGIEGSTSAAGRLIDSGDRVLLPILDAWAKRTDTGDRAELDDLPENLPLWKDLAVDADTCLGTDCPRHAECFVTRMRQRAAESDVVIVNHHLLCADASVRQSAFGEVIPDCSTLVVDEAHQLEDVATQYFGIALSSHKVDELVRDGDEFLARAHCEDRATREDLRRAFDRVGAHTRAFFTALALARPGENRSRYTSDLLAPCADDGMALSGALDGLEASLGLGLSAGSIGAASSVEPSPGPNGGSAARGVVEDAAALQRRAGELGQALQFLLRANDSDYVYFLEVRGRGVVLRAAPIDVSRIMRDALFDRFQTVVLTSATLAVDGSFEYIRGRLGVGRPREVRVASEFDYARQAVLYLPRRMPPPKAPAFAQAVAREVVDILRLTEGRAFVLFTSYAMLQTVQRVVEMSLPYPVLVQGSAPRTTILDTFRATPHAVLLATASFWQGVDVVGEALSCVIIDRLPFASPGDPIAAARIEAISASGGDAFAEYQVPLAILALQQGLGRLLRHRTDRGVLAILDPRLRTMGYGRRFLDSLPPAPVTLDLEQIGKFLARNGERYA